MLDYTSIFHTVPFKAKQLTRNEDGTKTNPGFPESWEQYASKQNTNNTPILGAIARTDFIGIDIDQTPLFNQAIALDPDCEYIAKSDLKGGHMLYKYTKEVHDRLRVIAKDAKKAQLDIQLGNKLIYLATPGNKTKTLLTDPLVALPQREVPEQLLAMIEAHVFRYLLSQPHLQLGASAQDTQYSSQYLENSTLGYLLDDPIASNTPQILDRVVPSSLQPKHPQDIEPGNGTEWMTSVRFRLAQDPSVSVDAFTKTMLYLNTLWDDPMPDARVLSDVKYDTTNKINSLTGEQLWQYNPDWANQGFTYADRYGDSIELMYDPAQALFLEYNANTNSHTIYHKQTDAVNSIISKSKTRVTIKGHQLLAKAEPVSIVNVPGLRPGKITAKREMTQFNKHYPTDGVLILSDLKTVKNPRHPEALLAYFEHLIVDPDNRKRFLQFIARKHRTYEHSELMFVLAGVPGAGKSLLVNEVLAYFAGPERMQDVDLDKLQNQFNSWKNSTDYVVIEEAGEGESKSRQALLVKELKTMTGKPTVNVTYKGKETGGRERHYMTPIVNTNMTTKLVTDSSRNDRRLVLFKCPNKMRDWAGDMSDFIAKMRAELPHFAHYLKSLEPITSNEYLDNEPWKNADYYEYIEVTQSPVDKMVEALDDKDLDKLMEVLVDDLAINPEQIDSMFSLSTGDEARALLYNTGRTRELSIFSLVDMADQTTRVSIDDLKQKTRRLSKKVIHRRAKQNYNMNVVAVPGIYKPLTHAPIDDITDEEVTL